MINKIEGPGSIRSAQPVKRAAKSGSAEGTSFSKHLDETGEAGAMQGVGATSSVLGVLNVQEVDDALTRASRGKRRAKDILDKLDELRIALLTGSIPHERLLQLSRMISAQRAEATDPKLTELLDEIDLRAQVELAKYAGSLG